MKLALDELRSAKLDVVLSQQKLEKFYHGAKNIDKMLYMGKTDSDKRGLGYDEPLPNAKTLQITKFVKASTSVPKHNMISTTHNHAKRVSHSQTYYCSICGQKGHIASYCRFVGPYQPYAHFFKGYKYKSYVNFSNVKSENVSRRSAPKISPRKVIRAVWVRKDDLSPQIRTCGIQDLELRREIGARRCENVRRCEDVESCENGELIAESSIIREVTTGCAYRVCDLRENAEEKKQISSERSSQGSSC
ncbi:hypothetical protein GIB67_000825 [Kingdonia uniflora]|uniref:CCHC-type domain-containing protein n=1 Tax=Kingdonia uniflora TaxID=39325 RepID=A0A7J7P005_9MAGN|nr:hypothetical protein GIB67_000825 [Kingdonia uniflora]